mmetsp:Transcript_123778/g.321506  ORF Transcript_123778/g.321506 Transcript_123778/m.321506 type:complete len:257 (+) Transcript_123778:513-1283(+)
MLLPREGGYLQRHTGGHGAGQPRAGKVPVVRHRRNTQGQLGDHRGQLRPTSSQAGRHQLCEGLQRLRRACALAPRPASRARDPHALRHRSALPGGHGGRRGRKEHRLHVPCYGGSHSQVQYEIADRRYRRPQGPGRHPGPPRERGGLLRRRRAGVPERRHRARLRRHPRGSVCGAAVPSYQQWEVRRQLRGQGPPQGDPRHPRNRPRRHGRGAAHGHARARSEKDRQGEMCAGQGDAVPRALAPRGPRGRARALGL